MVKIETLYNVPMEVIWRAVMNEARVTVGKEPLDKEPSNEFKLDMLKSEHSPIRIMMFRIYLEGLPSFVSQQFSRHRIAGQHSDFNGLEDINPTYIEHFVKTQRTDRTGIDRSKLPQDTPVNHTIYANAKGIIDMSRKRLCLLADPEAVKWWKKVKSEMMNVCPELSDRMQPECIYRGSCYEGKCCGYDKSNHFNLTLNNYKRK